MTGTPKTLFLLACGFSIFWLVGLFSASDAAGQSIRHTLLNASQRAQDCKVDHDNADLACGTPCGQPQMGLACRANLPSGGLLYFNKEKIAPVVGFFRRYDAGTQPCPCWEWVSSYSRAYVKFTLVPGAPDGLALGATVVSVVSAKLMWKPTTKRGSPDSPNLHAPNKCFGAIYEATGPWKASSTPGNLIASASDLVSSSIYIPQLAQKWLNPANNHGLFFTAASETLPAKEHWMCQTTLEGLQLDVVYRVK